MSTPLGRGHRPRLDLLTVDLVEVQGVSIGAGGAMVTGCAVGPRCVAEDLVCEIGSRSRDGARLDRLTGTVRILEADERCRP